ncbi:hypothetical protein HAX54_034714 [Datura stramonium]|uniref:Uncharacterized protein n=1 Tax=Datura stramonium TaxID=4076 RepID=A0ABS8VHA7_DATST|nr:hypothetical protein [Datura stramonium]
MARKEQSKQATQGQDGSDDIAARRALEIIPLYLSRRQIHLVVRWKNMMLTPMKLESHELLGTGKVPSRGHLRHSGPTIAFSADMVKEFYTNYMAALEHKTPAGQSWSQPRMESVA